MYNLEKICVLENITVREALEKIDLSGRKILIVVDMDSKLIGTITDGDIRRHLLKGVELQQTIQKIYNKNPRFCYNSAGRQAALKMMKDYSLDQIPIVTQERVVVGLEVFNANVKGIKIENPAIIMAGGLGTRLQPITTHLPKALTPIADKPILEIIINRLVNQGFFNFYISVNYKSEMIMEYLKDGSGWNANIQYIHEDMQLGTAGALSKLNMTNIDLPCVVMNCDILTTENFQDILEFHENEEAELTVATRLMTYEIPYGVVNVMDNRLVNIQEKPSHRFQVNAGIYVLNPKMIKLIPSNNHFNMTDLIQKALDFNLKVSAFPINSYWIDIGQMADLEKARVDYETLNL